MFKNKYSTGTILLVAFSVLGMVTMGYLISLHYSDSGSAFCNLGEGLSCDAVNKSIYSEVFSVPVSVLGFLYFAIVFLLALWKRHTMPYLWIVFMSVIALGPSLYLTGVEMVILENICIYCEISKVLIVAILVTAFASSGRARPTFAQMFIVTVLSLFLGWAAYLSQVNVVPPGKYAAFAQCVYRDGMRMYGAKTCSFCIRQRALFGDAMQYIREIECDPRYPNNETERCIAKEIERTPTWMREDETGNTLKRYEPGVLSLETIAVETGCVLP